MKILAAGASGFIGHALLQQLLEEKHEILLLTRDPHKIQEPSIKVLAWDGKNLGGWAQKAQGVEAVINLSGQGIADKGWTAERKKELIDSRIHSTRALIEFVRSCPQKPSVFINASAVGYYGDVPHQEITESFPRGSGFLAEVCELWEKEASKAAAFGIRTVMLRTGIVLEKDGGAVQKMLLPFKLFMGGPLGNGKQWVPWIHREDEVNAIVFILTHSDLAGPVNLTAPLPVTMKEFCSALGKTIRRPCWAPVPGFILRLLLEEMSELLLGGQRAVPKKLLDAGFVFRYPRCEEALKAIFA